MLEQMAAAEEAAGGGDKPDDPNIHQAQNLFSEAFKEMEKEAAKIREEKGTSAENGGQPTAQKEAGNEPFGDMSSMFKDFERIAKESAEKPNTNSAEDPFSKLLGGLMGAGGEDESLDDKQMMDMFKGLMGSLGSGQGGAPPTDDQMQEMLKQFTSMLNEGEGNNEF